MSTELSRVRSHKRRKQEKKQKRAQKKQRFISSLKPGFGSMAHSKAKSHAGAKASHARSRRRPDAESKPDMELDQDGSVPARTETYASQKIKISKYFINTLIVLFMLLTAFLVWWGVMDAPPLEELW